MNKIIVYPYDYPDLMNICDGSLFDEVENNIDNTIYWDIENVYEKIVS